MIFTNENTVVFGGTFDPVTFAHVLSAEELSEKFPLVVIAPTGRNPFKERKPTPRDVRLEMWRRALRYVGLRLTERVTDGGIYLCDYEYVYARDFVEYWMKLFGTSVTWAIGPDLVEEYPKWSGGWMAENVTPYVMSDKPFARATEVRAGRAKAHPAVEGLIAELGLYGS